MTTALQRKLIVGALDFSPLRHSPALAERHYYTKNRPSGAAKFEEIRTAGVRYEITARTKSRRMCRGGAEVVFRRNAISRESPVHQRQVGGLEPTVAREHVCGPDVISTATVNGAREGARVEIMSVGCPQTAGRASRSGQVPDYLSRNIPSAPAPPLAIRLSSCSGFCACRGERRGGKTGWRAAGAREPFPPLCGRGSRRASSLRERSGGSRCGQEGP